MRYKPKLERLEGGWSDDPSDPGGATMCGVTLGTYRSYYGHDKTKQDLRQITDRQWTHIMRDYWDRCKADRIDKQSVAEIFVDWYINAGCNAIRNVQFRLGLKADGIVGEQTLSALNATPAKDVFNLVKTARIEYYNKIGKRLPKFLKGWLSRVEHFSFIS